MTSEPERQKHEIALAWTPRTFSGNDLLPLVAPPVEGAEEKEELVTHENIDITTDFVVPQLKLLQGISDEVAQGQPGAIPGKFVLTSTGEILEPPLRVLIVFHGRSRALFPNPSRPNTVGLDKCIARDGVTGTRYGDCASCKHKEWPEEKELSPPCSEAHNFVALLPQGPAVLRFGRTSFKAARKFISQVIISGENFWQHPTIIRVRQEQRDVGGKKATYFVMDAGWEVPETVPIGYRKNARESFDKIKAAADAGKLRAGEEEDPE